MRESSETAAAALVVSHQSSIDRLTLNAPASRNALSIALMERLITEIEASAERGSRALVIGHTGSVFCSGVNLKEREVMRETPQRHSQLLSRLLATLWSYPAPVVCCVKGPVRGGGMGLVACGDIVVCGPNADFGFSEVRIGVVPALIGSFCLAGSSARQLNPWLLSGSTFGATDAMRLGLVTRIADDVGASVSRELTALLRGAPASQRATKRLMRDLTGVDPRHTLSSMQKLSAKVFTTAEAMEGMLAFEERRLPAWATAFDYKAPPAG